MIIRTIAAAAAVLSWASAAQATLVTFTDRSAFESYFTSVITYTPGGNFGFEPQHQFGGALLQPYNSHDIGATDATPLMAGPEVWIEGGDSFFDFTSVDPSANTVAVFGMGFDILSFGATFEVTVIGHGSVLQTFDLAPPSGQVGFFGVASLDPTNSITQLRISDEGPAMTDYFDNFTIASGQATAPAPVPLPAPLALLAAGLLGLAAFGRRKA